MEIVQWTISGTNGQSPGRALPDGATRLNSGLVLHSKRVEIDASPRVMHLLQPVDRGRDAFHPGLQLQRQELGIVP